MIMPRGAGPSTSLAIRDYLLEHEEGYAWQIAEKVISEFEGTGYQPPTHSSVAQIMHSCEELGLIELVRTEPSERMEEEPTEETRKRKQRKIYKIAEGKEDDIRWRDPVKANYQPEKFNEELPMEITDEMMEERMEKVREKRGE